MSFSVQKSGMNEKGDRQDSIGKANIKSIFGPPELHMECIKNHVFSCVLSAIIFSLIFAQSGAQSVGFRRASMPGGVQFTSQVTSPWSVGSTRWGDRACFGVDFWLIGNTWSAHIPTNASLEAQVSDFG